MEVAQVLHMNKGDGETSYYQNSNNQQRVILRAKPILHESIAKVCEESTAECLSVADLGTSSGPNTLLPLWEMIETIDSTCPKLNKKPPVLRVFLNDLPGTDFNMIFGSLVPEFHVKLEEKNKNRTPETCLIGAMPGSFYTKLFPNNSLHFVHSSGCLHWLAQVPEELVTEDGVALNKGNICLTKASPPIVHELYFNQFKDDFTEFLKRRSEELKSGGGMVLSLQTQSPKNPYCNFAIWELIGLSVQDVVNEGKLEQFKLDAYNIPYYSPAIEDVMKAIENEGSFSLERFEEYEMGLNIIFDETKHKTLSDKAKHVATQSRAVGESLIASEFGAEISEDVFRRLAYRAQAYIEEGNHFTYYLIFSLTKK